MGNILVDQHSQVTRLTDRGAGKQTDNTNKQPSSLVGNIQVDQHSQVTRLTDRGAGKQTDISNQAVWWATYRWTNTVR